MASIVKGQCHCGNLTISMTLTKLPSEMSPRSCDCDFCVMHGASYVSDRDGSLTITVRQHGEVLRYRQGNELAEFLLCAKCGALAAVTYETDGKRYGAVNSLVIDRAHAFAEKVSVSPKKLNPQEKTERWKNAWFSRVELIF